MKMNEREKNREDKKPESIFKPSYKPEEQIEGKLKKFTIERGQEPS